MNLDYAITKINNPALIVRNFMIRSSNPVNINFKRYNTEPIARGLIKALATKLRDLQLKADLTSSSRQTALGALWNGIL